MTDHDDREARIMAYLDGALSDTEMAAFEAEMEADEALAEDVARLLGNDELLRQAFADPLEQGVDDALLERMGLADPGAAKVVPPVAAANDNPPFWRRWQLPLGGALAASLALALTFSLRGPQEDLSQFASAMDSLPSGESILLADGSELAPVLTFAAADGRYCREFRLSGETGNGGGIACRGDDSWAVVALAGDTTDLASMEQIELASGADTSSLDDAYAALGASDPFDAVREQQLIAADWQAE